MTQGDTLCDTNTLLSPDTGLNHRESSMQEKYRNHPAVLRSLPPLCLAFVLSLEVSLSFLNFIYFFFNTFIEVKCFSIGSCGCCCCAASQPIVGGLLSSDHRI